MDSYLDGRSDVSLFSYLKGDFGILYISVVVHHKGVPSSTRGISSFASLTDSYSSQT